MAAEAISTLLQEILSWMDDHDDVLPKLHNTPTPEQKAEATLRTKYKNYLARNHKLSSRQRKLQDEIDRRQTDPVDLDNIELIEKWSAQHNGTLPIHTREDVEQYALANRLRRLRGKERKSPVLQQRLAELDSRVRTTPTKKNVRGAVYKKRKQLSLEFMTNLTSAHEEWWQHNYPNMDPEERKDRRDRGQPKKQSVLIWPDLADVG